MGKDEFIGILDIAFLVIFTKSTLADFAEKSAKSASVDFA